MSDLSAQQWLQKTFSETTDGTSFTAPGITESAFDAACSDLGISQHQVQKFVLRNPTLRVHPRGDWSYISYDPANSIWFSKDKVVASLGNTAFIKLVNSDDGEGSKYALRLLSIGSDKGKRVVRVQQAESIVSTEI